MARKASPARKPKAKRSRPATAAREASRGPDADRLRLCKEGKHPPSRRIGTGCAVCGRMDAWGRR